jgi:hypothetical protein
LITIAQFRGKLTSTYIARRNDSDKKRVNRKHSTLPNFHRAAFGTYNETLTIENSECITIAAEKKGPYASFR